MGPTECFGLTGKSPAWCTLWRRWTLENLYPVLGAFPGGSSDKEPTCRCRKHKRRRFDPWVGKIPRRDPMDRGDWLATVHGVAKSWTRLK